MSGVVVPFEISVQAGGQRVATNGVQTLVLAEPEGPAGGRLFRRRAVRGVGTPGAQPVEWAVAELDGVRVYLDGATVVVTRADLNP
jgi:hypothetical protein